MGGGGSSKPQTVNVQAPPIKDVPHATLPTGPYSGLGYTPVEQTFTPGGKPPWMTGVWDMPQWGMSAADPTQSLQQSDLQAQQYEQPPQPQPQNNGMGDLMPGYMDWSRRRAPLTNFQFGSNYDTGGLPTVTKTPVSTSFGDYIKFLQQPEWAQQMMMSGRRV